MFGVEVRDTRTLPLPSFLFMPIRFMSDNTPTLIVRLKEKARGYFSIDNAIDVLVDVALVVFDALTTPILIPIRVGKYYLKELVLYITKSTLKNTAKKKLGK